MVLYNACKKDQPEEIGVRIRNEAKTIKLTNLTGNFSAEPAGFKNSRVYFTFGCDTCSKPYLISSDGNLMNTRMEKINHFNGWFIKSGLQLHVSGLQNFGYQNIGPSINSVLKSHVSRENCEPYYSWGNWNTHRTGGWANF